MSTLYGNKQLSSRLAVVVVVIVSAAVVASICLAPETTEREQYN